MTDDMSLTDLQAALDRDIWWAHFFVYMQVAGLALIVMARILGLRKGKDETP